MRKWYLIMSVDADTIAYKEVIISECEPDFWTCYKIAECHGCPYFTVYEAA